MGGHADVIEFFLGKGVSIDDTDWKGWTPLYYASAADKLELAKFLVNKGANIHVRDNGLGMGPVQSMAST
jgi:ankyrin repeat protein